MLLLFTVVIIIASYNYCYSNVITWFLQQSNINIITPVLIIIIEHQSVLCKLSLSLEGSRPPACMSLYATVQIHYADEMPQI